MKKTYSESGFAQLADDLEKTNLPSTWVWQPGRLHNKNCASVSGTVDTFPWHRPLFLCNQMTTTFFAWFEGQWSNTVVRSVYSHYTETRKHQQRNDGWVLWILLSRCDSTSKKPLVIFQGFYLPPPDYLTSACVNSTVHPLFVRGQTIVGSQIGKICITGNKMDTKQATVNFNIFVQIRWAGKLVITIITRFLIICER